MFGAKALPSPVEDPIDRPKRYRWRTQVNAGQVVRLPRDNCYRFVVTRTAVDQRDSALRRVRDSTPLKAGGRKDDSLVGTHEPHVIVK